MARTAALTGIFATHTSPTLTSVLYSAGVAVVAGQVVECKNAAAFGLTTIAGAHVAIVTINWLARLTFTITASITGSAGILIIASCRIIDGITAKPLLAKIIGADIAIFAVDGVTRNTKACAAIIILGAKV